MYAVQWFQPIAVGLACLGLVLPRNALAAGPQEDHVRENASPQRSGVQDVALQPGGVFQGRVVDAEGHPLEGTTVSVTRDEKTLAETVADRNGVFRVRNLRGGMYSVRAGSQQSWYRLWAPQTAPPAAETAATLVSGGQVVRGQDPLQPFSGQLDVVSLTAFAAAVTAAGLGIANAVKLDDIEDEIASP